MIDIRFYTFRCGISVDLISKAVQTVFIYMILKTSRTTSNDGDKTVRSVIGNVPITKSIYLLFGPPFCTNVKLAMNKLIRLNRKNHSMEMDCGTVSSCLFSIQSDIFRQSYLSVGTCVAFNLGLLCEKNTYQIHRL